MKKTLIYMALAILVLGSLNIVSALLAEGDYIDSFAITELAITFDIAVQDNFLYIAEDGANVIAKYDFNGNQISNFTTNASNLRPLGLTTNGTFIWVSDFGDDHIFRYDMEGNNIQKTPLTGLTSQGLTNNGTMLFNADTDDNIYRYKMNGDYTNSFSSGINLQRGVATWNQYMYISSSTINTLTRNYTNASGRGLSNIDLNVANTDAHGVTTDGSYIWVVDNAGKTIYRYYSGLNEVQVKLGVPINNSFNINSPMVFNASLVSGINYNFTNTTIKIYNSAGNLINKSTKLVLGNGFNSTNFSISNLPVGDLTWNIEACVDDQSKIVCSFADKNYTLNYGIKINNQTYTTPVFTSAEENFKINIDYNNTIYTNIIARIVYNGTSYLATRTGTGLNTIFSINLTIPIVSGSSTTNFYWNFTLTNSTGSIFYLDNDNNQETQTINGITFALCNATYNVPYINFTFEDELLGSAMNGSFEVTFEFWVAGSPGLNAINFSFKNITENLMYSFCVSPNYTNLQVNMEAQYSSTGFSDRTYYLNNASLTNSTNEIILYLLNSSSSTKFFINVQNGIDPFNDATVLINKRFVGEGVWTTVGIRKTDEDGKFIEYLELDENYQFIILRDGSSFGVLEKSATCSIDPCELTLQVEGVLVDIWSAFSDNYAQNIFSNISWNPITKIVTYTFVDITGLSNYFRFEVKEISMNKTVGQTICNEFSYSTSGVMICNLTGLNGEFIAKGFISRSPEILDKIFGFFISDAVDTLGLLGILLNIGIIITMVLCSAAVSRGSPSAIVFILALTILLLKIGGIFPFSWIVVAPIELILVWLLMKSKA